MIEPNSLQLDKNSAVPLYEQLRRTLLAAITSGRMAVGTKLPTEEELCAALEISRPVVRQAYNRLIEEGFVERMRGKGTFVRSMDTRGRFLNRQLSFAAEMQLLDLDYRTEVLQQEWQSYDPVLFPKLNLGPSDRCLHLVRMRYVSGAPFVLVENDIPEPLFPGIDTHDFAAESLYAVMERDYHSRPQRAQRTLSAQLADARFAGLFGVAVGAPVLYVENLVLDQQGRPIDWSREYLDGSVQKFEFEVVNP